MKIMSIDPGIMSGYTYAELEGGKLEFFPFQMTDAVDDLWRRFRTFKPRIIIIESFVSRKGKGGVELFPVQLIGITNLYGNLADHPCGVYEQTPAQGKTYYSNTQLQHLKLYKRGIPHAMDATRHLLYWCTFGAGNQYVGKNREFATMLPIPKKEWG